MSVETLRRAAALMRERAEVTTPGPWITHEMDSIFVGNQADGRTSGLWAIVHSSSDCLADMKPAAADRVRADAEHIASWDPVVALAVADWLDWVATALDDDGHPYPNEVLALAVARAYLGDQA
jgi:hypothetical protein